MTSFSCVVKWAQKLKTCSLPYFDFWAELSQFPQDFTIVVALNNHFKIMSVNNNFSKYEV